MRKSSRGKIEIIIGIILISIFCLETIGYAYYNRILNIGGNITLAKDGNILSANPACENLFSMSEDILKNASFYHLITSDNNEDLTKILYVFSLLLSRIFSHFLCNNLLEGPRIPLRISWQSMRNY